MSKLSKRHFWEWFKRNNKEYLDLNNKTKKEATYWLNELNAHLRAYYKFFEYRISLPDKGIPNLTITVSGKAMHFKKVDLFVATAPEIAGWQISALEDPMPIEFLLEKHMESTGIHPAEFSFSFASEDPEDTNVIIYHPLCTPQNEGPYLQLAYAAVYNLVGERAFGLDIGQLEMSNLSTADPDDVYPLEELLIHISLRKPAMVVGPNGTLEGLI
ncbi:MULTISPECIES: hypothetical protein [Niastella]|uniref:Suppressor of fused-like domain-containing protein n=1 Tax=Niastella soli TaxID=2821487 RepID=A0ABS3Z3M7_9BACT|nr:hypothetical protein [Niastella soli]MBO9204772.1 hypothetical protein [Niastella soli]